jgi:hypothetical protein
VDEGPPFHHIKMSDMDLEVLFVALDRPQDISKLLSMELTGAWVNEAREVPRPVIDGLTGRVGRYPSMAMGGTGWSGIIADTEPPDSDHCWYKLAEFEVTEKLPLYVGIDFVLTPAATIAQRTALGPWCVHTELVTEDMERSGSARC